MAQLSVEMGYIKAENVPEHPLRHMLTQAIGEGLDEIQTRREGVEAGDTFLLCTDGLYGMLSDGDIRKILRGASAGSGACDRLVEAALVRGGQDDVTAIAVQV